MRILWPAPSPMMTLPSDSTARPVGARKRADVPAPSVEAQLPTAPATTGSDAGAADRSGVAQPSSAPSVFSVAAGIGAPPDLAMRLRTSRCALTCPRAPDSVAAKRIEAAAKTNELGVAW